MYDTHSIKKVFEKDMGKNVTAIQQFEGVENNAVYKIETPSQAYIFKIYRIPNWPEDGKLLLVDRLLTERGIPHAKIFVYNRDATHFPNGYLIEECLPGITADRLTLSRDELISLFQQLGALATQLHKIQMKGYGYTGTGEALWCTYSEFMYDSMGDNNGNLLAHKITDEEELERIGQEFWARLKVWDKYPPVLCHTDLSTKNMLVHEGNIGLIDWDDVYSLPWVHDIAELTFWLKREYGEAAEIYRNAFFSHYQTEYDMEDFYETEPVLHARIGLGGLNYFIGTPKEAIIKQLIKDALQKSEMGMLKMFL
ncbi:MAG: aminoglycoside phosphotransferase family protein [Defluviitaleaceae bacterium]|nr:aminoglycoside phosphotransferase family protein [Defluviitaleaceae bacterium]MCL2275734.1 aminoglycoside phosphotransferase family protein [Defluviitaleaceae bacterium]